MTTEDKAVLLLGPVTIKHRLYFFGRPVDIPFNSFTSLALEGFGWLGRLLEEKRNVKEAYVNKWPEIYE